MYDEHLICRKANSLKNFLKETRVQVDRDPKKKTQNFNEWMAVALCRGVTKTVDEFTKVTIFTKKREKKE